MLGLEELKESIEIIRERTKNMKKKISPLDEFKKKTDMLRTRNRSFYEQIEDIFNHALANVEKIYEDQNPHAHNKTGKVWVNTLN